MQIPKIFTSSPVFKIFEMFNNSTALGLVIGTIRKTEMEDEHQWGEP